MEYNKKNLTKLNDRKILHKVRKHWVIVSLALLGVIGGGAMTQIKASANMSPARFTNGFNLPINATSSNQNVTLTSSYANHGASSSQSLTLSSQASLSQQATDLHNHIVAHAATSQSNKPTSLSTGLNMSSRSTQQKSLINPVTVQGFRTPHIQTEKWGRTQIKFVSDGDHGNAGGDVAVVEPGAISDAFYEQNNSDTTYNSDHFNGVKGCYIVNRYNDDLQLPFDQTNNNWSLKFAPGVFLPKDAGVSKNDQTPKNGESTNDVDYTRGAIKTNDYRYLFSSTNRSLWNHFKTMDLTNLNTDNAEDLSNMFAGDQSLQKVVLNDSSNPKLTELHGMFADDPQLREVDFNHFNTSNVTNLDSMFMSDIRLRHLDLSDLDTHNVTNMHAMFMSDLALSDIQGIDQLNTGRVTNMISMFSRDQALPQLRLDRWDTGNVTSMAEMFSGDANLRDLDLSGFDTRRVSDMSSMFTQDGQLQSLNLANFDTRNVRAIFPGMPVGGMSFMFSGDNQLNKLVLGLHTNLDGPNQNWNSTFFNQIFDVNGNDATTALKTGRQLAGIYYSANYYNHILLVQQYLSEESEIDDQILSNANVRKDPEARARVQQSISQTNELEKSADAELNTASVNPQVLNDINSVSNLTSLANKQISSATQWVSSASSAASLSNYQASVSRTAASVSTSVSASKSASASLSQLTSKSTSTSVSASISTSNRLKASISASLSTKSSASESMSVKASLSQSTKSFNDSVSVSVSASTSASASSLASLNAAASASKSISASASASLSSSASLNKSRSNSNVSTSASGIIKNDINEINFYDQVAQYDDNTALNNLNQLNVSSNASLSALKNNDINEVHDDESIVSEETSSVNSFSGDLRNGSYKSDLAANNVNNQVTAASKIAQDASLIIEDDITALKSAADQTRSDSNYPTSSSDSNRTYNNSNAFASSSGQINSVPNNPGINSGVLTSSQINSGNKINSSASAANYRNSIHSMEPNNFSNDSNDSLDNVKSQNSANNSHNLLNSNNNSASSVNNTAPSQSNNQSTSPSIPSASSDDNSSKSKNDSGVNANNSSANNTTGNNNSKSADSNNNNVGNDVEQPANGNNDEHNLPRTGESSYDKAVAAALLAIAINIGALGTLINRRRRYNQ